MEKIEARHLLFFIPRPRQRHFDDTLPAQISKEEKKPLFGAKSSCQPCQDPKKHLSHGDPSALVSLFGRNGAEILKIKRNISF